MLEQKYDVRKFDATYKIDRKPAIHYLSAKGIAALKADPRFNPATLHSYYKNKSVSDAYVQHTVTTLEVYNFLKQSYADHFEIFTRQEVAYFDYLPATKPDLYLHGEAEYFIVLAHDMQPFLVRKQLAEYIAHSEDEGWNRDDHPTLLFVFDMPSRQRAFLRSAASALESAGIDTDELPIGATTVKALQHAPKTSAIWSFAGDLSVPRLLSV